MTKHICAVCGTRFWGETYGLCGACETEIADIRRHPEDPELRGLTPRELLTKRVYQRKYHEFIKGLEDLPVSLQLPAKVEMSYGKMVALRDRVGYFKEEKQ